MADYPTGSGVEYSASPITKQSVDVAEAGNIRGVNLEQTPVYRITVKHPTIPVTERDTLLDHYKNNKAEKQTLTVGGITFSANYQSGYRIKSVSATFYDMTTTLIGVDVSDWVLVDGGWSDAGDWLDAAGWNDS